MISEIGSIDRRIQKIGLVQTYISGTALHSKSLPFMLPDEVCGVWGACEVNGNGEPEEVAECSSLELTALHISNMLNAVVTVWYDVCQADASLNHRVLFAGPA